MQMYGIDHIAAFCLFPTLSCPPLPCLLPPFWEANTFLKGILEIVCTDGDGAALRRASSLLQYSLGRENLCEVEG